MWQHPLVAHYAGMPVMCCAGPTASPAPDLSCMLYFGCFQSAERRQGWGGGAAQVSGSVATVVQKVLHHAQRVLHPHDAPSAPVPQTHLTSAQPHRFDRFCPAPPPPAAAWCCCAAPSQASSCHSCLGVHVGLHLVGHQCLQGPLRPPHTAAAAAGIAPLALGLGPAAGPAQQGRGQAPGPRPQAQPSAGLAVRVQWQMSGVARGGPSPPCACGSPAPGWPGGRGGRGGK
jgi:hypothetical protein